MLYVAFMFDQHDPELLTKDELALSKTTKTKCNDYAIILVK